MSCASQGIIDSSMTAPGKDTIHLMRRSLEVGVRRLSYLYYYRTALGGERLRKGCGSQVVGFNTGRLFLWGKPRSRDDRMRSTS